MDEIYFKWRKIAFKVKCQARVRQSHLLVIQRRYDQVRQAASEEELEDRLTRGEPTEEQEDE